MSKTVELDLNCPRCETSFRATLYRTIWVEFPENMDLIENDRINLVHCPACGLSEMLPFPFMATNVRKKFAVWYEPFPDINIDSDIALYRQHFGADSYYARAQRFRDWGEFKERLAQLNNLPDVPATTEDFSRLRQGMQSAYAHRSEPTPKPSPKDEMLAKVIRRLREKGYTIPNSVAEIPDFPCPSFAALKNSISRNELAFYCPALSYSIDIFPLLAKRTESLKTYVAIFVMCAMPIISILLAIFVSWPWALLAPLFLLVGWKLGRSTYMKTLFRSATESERKFCFLFYSYAIGVAVLPGITKAYVWQGPHPKSSSIAE